MPAVFVSGLFSSSKVNALAVSLRWIPWCVVLGHSDRHDRLATPLKWYHLTWSLLLLIAATRLSADFVPKVLGYAAALWVTVILFWAWKITKDASPRFLGRALKLPTTHKEVITGLGHQMSQLAGPEATL